MWGYASARPRRGYQPGGVRIGPEIGNAREINELPTRYPHSGQLYIMGIIRTDSDNPLRINDLRVV